MTLGIESSVEGLYSGGSQPELVKRSKGPDTLGTS